MKFTEEDIKDKERLSRMIKKEADAIFRSSDGRKGRDLDTIEYCVKQGKVAELYLIENHGFIESDIKYHDLINAFGEYVEVKAYDIWDSTAPYVQKDIRRYKNAEWSKSKWYMLFRCKHGEYEFLEKIDIKPEETIKPTIVMKSYPEINGVYRHYKGGMYKVLFLSTHTETDEVLVNYQSVHFGSYYSRPLSSWNEQVESTERFELI